MPYPELFVRPMREELAALGVDELRSADEVDAAVAAPGTLLIVVNSVCGCAAGRARPAVALALRHGVRPDRLTSVFAGFDVEATERARRHFAPHPPSSPSIALLRDGRTVFMLGRHQIENRSAQDIATDLTAAFDRVCGVAESPLDDRVG